MRLAMGSAMYTPVLYIGWGVNEGRNLNPPDEVLYLNYLGQTKWVLSKFKRSTVNTVKKREMNVFKRINGITDHYLLKTGQDISKWYRHTTLSLN